jgi:hypothetical protein
VINEAFAVPTAWRMTAHVVGLSGSSTTRYRREQQPAMEQDLLSPAHAGSWNVVSTTGGADNTVGKNKFTFVDAVKEWYETAIVLRDLHGIWTASLIDAVGCPYTEGVYQTARAARQGITTDISAILADAWNVDHSVRLIDVYYPYVLPKSESCAQGGGLNPSKHGTTAVIDMLAAAHDDVPAQVQSLTGGAAAVGSVDLRDPNSVYGSAKDPRNLLQLVAYYGYPHVNAEGQEDIASMAVARLTGG